MAPNASAGALTNESLSKAGLSAAAIALLTSQDVTHLDEVHAFGADDWAHLFANGLTLGHKRKLLEMVEQFQARPLSMPPPPNIKFNFGSIIVGLAFAAPSIVIGAIHEFGAYGATRALLFDESMLFVLLPGAAYLILMIIIIEANRSTFSTDVLEQRSVGVSVRDAMRSALTNMAVVAALLLTVIIAMMQVDSPIDEPRALLGQWYQIFLYSAMVPCFSAVILSSMLLLYIEPLDESAAVSFVGTFVDFFGEPSFAVIFGIANFVPAMTLWMFGAYGFAVGLVSALSTVLLIRKVLLTYLYMNNWTNTDLDSETMATRMAEAKQLRQASKISQSLHNSRKA
ncbi:hypothetical protein KFE25_004117 [Diacronema lutheri]|uniref:Uncharacterized protein n=1 Tax=Diacronema lutheri TaxID=2081491 RepID=A0A8J5X737_DIALT|nr:hypothetical protein KFE25_004117 [Diacronema lutheri]